MRRNYFTQLIDLPATLARRQTDASIRLPSFFIGFLMTLPACWFAYSMSFAVFRCLTIKPGLGTCLMLYYLAPLIMMTPAIIHDDEEPVTTHRLEVVLFAFVLALLWVGIASFRKIRRKMKRCDIER